MSAAGALAGLRVLVTRPAHQSDTLCRLIEKGGGEAMRLPLLSIEPVTPALVRRQLDVARGFDWWIFTSPNAVQSARAADSGGWPKGLAAVGPATAAALESAANAPVLAPLQGASSKALLARAELAQLQGKRVLIVTGADGLDVLPTQLEQRGATVVTCAVYHRVPLPHPPDAIESAVKRSKAIVLTSGQALEHLWELASASTRVTLARRQLVVPSRRVVEMARTLGFARAPLAPEQMSDAAIVHCLETWWKPQTNP
jgi:uroporphyrinogen-III synthase